MYTRIEVGAEQQPYLFRCQPSDCSSFPKIVYDAAAAQLTGQCWHMQVYSLIRCVQMYAYAT